MTSIHTAEVVVGIDGGPGSAGALRYAVDRAGQVGTGLRLVHVSPSYPPVSPMMPSLPVEIARTGDEILERARQEVLERAPGLTVTTDRRVGPRIAELVAASRDARMLVVGRETRSAFERLLGAGTTSGVAAHAAVPVMVVPQDWRADVDQAPVVMGLKSAEHSDDAFGAAFRTAQEAGAPLVVVHAWKLPEEYDDLLESRTHSDLWRERGQRLADQALDEWRREFPDVPVTVEVVHADPARALVVASQDARLLVLARRSPRLVGRHLGGTAAAVIRAAHSPVLVVPASRLVIDEPGLEIEQSGAMLR